MRYYSNRGHRNERCWRSHFSLLLPPDDAAEQAIRSTEANSVGAHILVKVSNTIFEIKRLLNIHSYYSYRYFLDIISAEHQCLS